MAKKPAKPPKVQTPEQIQAAQQKAQNKALGGLYGNEGVNAGNALIQKFGLAKEGGLGMVSTDIAGQENIGQRNQALLGKAGNSPAELEAQAKMQAGLGGYTSPEYQASREQMMRGVQSDFRTASGQLAKAQARGKVYGAAGAAQQANLATSSQRSKDELEQDLMVKNIDEQQKRLQSYGKYSSDLQQQGFDQNSLATVNANKSTMDLNNATLDREKINLGQEDTRVASAIGALTGAGGTALTKAQTKAAQQIQREGIAAINGMSAKKKAA